MKNFNLYNVSFLKNYNALKNQEFPLPYLVGMAYSEYKRGISNRNIKGNMLSYINGSYFEPTICMDLSIYQEQINEYKNYLTIKIIEDSITSYEKALLGVLNRESIPYNRCFKYVGIIASFPSTFHMMKRKLEFEDYIDSIREKSDYFGMIKKRYNIKLKIISKKYHSKWGIYTFNAVDDDDNLFFWFERKEVKFDVSDRVKIRATVKKHVFSEFLKTKETHLSRVVYS